MCREIKRQSLKIGLFMNDCVFGRYATQGRVTQMHRCKNLVKDEINSLVYKIRHYFQVRTFAW